MKKSADQYARAATSRTGVLDTNKLHTYRYNEDIFKKVTVMPDGKNHGLIMLLDWSGSMGQLSWILSSKLIILFGFVGRLVFLSVYMLSKVDSLPLSESIKRQQWIIIF